MKELTTFFYFIFQFNRLQYGIEKSKKKHYLIFFVLVSYYSNRHNVLCLISHQDKHNVFLFTFDLRIAMKYLVPNQKLVENANQAVAPFGTFHPSNEPTASSPYDFTKMEYSYIRTE